MSTRSNKPPVIKNKKTTSSRPKPVYEVEDKKKEFSCLRCDRKFKVQTNNFFYTNSAIYRANNYYVSICKTCVEELFTHYKNILGDEYEAMRRVCIKLDWYYSPIYVDSAKKKSAERGWISAYASTNRLHQNKEKTYDDTLDEERKDTIDSIEDMEKLKDENKLTISDEIVKRWGFGFTAEEYSIMEEHYKMLSQKIVTEDVVQETLVRDLCLSKVLQCRAVQSGETDKFEKLTKLYQATLASAKIKIDTGKFDVDADTFGTWIKDIESYCPAEYYKDKKKYKDYIGTESDWERHIVRPFKNLATGSKDMDEEYVIKDDADA